MPEESIRTSSKSAWISPVLLFVAVPLTIWAGMTFFDDRKYYVISMLLTIYAIIPFVASFERRKPQASELLLVAVLTAIAVAGRAAFFMLPQMKPVVALIILAAVCFGRETGFLTGAMTAFISNFFFGQGPYVPWQMFAMGLIGWLAGVLAEKGLLKKEARPLAIFGGLAAFLLYGLIMDTCTLFLISNTVNRELVIATFAAGVPFNLLHGGATAVFLLLLTKPMCEKLERVRIKYGLLKH